VIKLTRENIRILLVDDDANDRGFLRASLLAEGFLRPPTELGNGNIALEYFKYTKATGSVAPHVIIMDVNMPLIDGVHALQLLREASDFRDVPVIILTASTDPAQRRTLAHLGIFRFLKKLPNCAGVISALDDFIDLYNHQCASLAD